MLTSASFSVGFSFSGFIVPPRTSPILPIFTPRRVTAWKTHLVRSNPPAPTTDAANPLSPGTQVVLDAHARFLSPGLLAGGSPWRLVHVPIRSREILHSWRSPGVVDETSGGLARQLVNQGFLHPITTAVRTVDDVTIIIPVHNDIPGLSRTLRSFGFPRVIVVDDASDIPVTLTDEISSVIRHEINRGPAAARNSGLAAATTPFVLFVDANITTHDAHLLVATLRQHFDDPMVAAVAPRVVGLNTGGPRGSFEEQFSPLDLGALSSVVVPHGRVSYVPSACMLVRRDVLGQGFDEELRRGEDVDLVWRLHDAGWLVRYEASVTVQHPPRDSWPEWLAQRHGYGRSAGPLARRHPTRLSPVGGDLWTTGSLLALLFGQKKLAVTISAMAQRLLREQLPEEFADNDQLVRDIVLRGAWQSAGPLARGVVRAFGPLLFAAAVLKILRRPALVLLVVGTLWRFRGSRPNSALHLPLAMVDDAAYATGVWRGSWESRTFLPVTPRITGWQRAASGLRSLLTQRERPSL